MREPDLTGPGGRAWHLPNDARWGTCLAAQLVEARGYHAAIYQWVIAVIHLRDGPGRAPAHRRYPEAEHEFAIVSIDPAHPVDLDEVDGPEFRIHFVTPEEVRVQFHGLGDGFAAPLVESAVRMVVLGAKSPDSDFRVWWEAAVETTLDHFRRGIHPVG